MGLLKNLLPQIIYEGSTDYSNDIKVIKYAGTTKLIVNGFVQSFNKGSGYAKNKVWGSVVEIITANKKDLNNVLVLGMGGGTMLHLLNKNFKNTNITAVEIDKVIIDLARKYFELDKINNLTVINDDAIKVLLNSKDFFAQSKFDCVIVDTYIGGEYPQDMDFKALKAILDITDENSLVIFNRIVYKDKESLIEPFVVELNKLMNNIQLKKITYPSFADNYIFYGYSTKSNNDRQ